MSSDRKQTVLFSINSKQKIAENLDEQYENIKPKIFSLRIIYDYPKTNELLIDYLKKIFCKEQYLFLAKLKEYKNSISQRKRGILATDMINTFVRAKSEFELNLSSKNRKATITEYEHCCDSENFTDSLFQHCEDQIFFDLQEDTFPSFIKEDSFINLMKKEFESLGEEIFKSRFLLSASCSQLKLNINSKKRVAMIVQQKKNIPIQVEIPNSEKFLIQNTEFKSVEYMKEIIHEMMKVDSGVDVLTSSFKKRKREFNGQSSIDWLKNFFKSTDEKPLFEFMNLLIDTKNISGKSPFDTKQNYIFNIKKKVIVIGGGYGGMFAAKGLKNDFDVTLIDAKDVNEYSISFYKLFHQPIYIDKLETQWNKVCNCKFIQSKVASITPTYITLANNENLYYDYLVVATGSRFYIPFPIYESVSTKQTKVIVPYQSENIISAYSDIHFAKTIVIVGGGALGCEIAGEIAYNKPKTQVILISQCGSLMNRRSLSVQKTTLNNLSAYSNLKILFFRKVFKIENGNVYCQNIFSKDKEGMEAISACVAVVCIGFRPNTNVFRENMSDSLNTNGYVCVNNLFQVKYKMNTLTPYNHIEETFKHLEKEERELLENEKLKKEDSFKNLKIEEDVNENNLMDAIKTGADVKETIDKTQIETSDNVYKHIFALGDIIDSNEEKLASYARIQGEKVAKNIIAYEFQNKNENWIDKSSPYIFGKNELMMFIATGNTGIFVKGEKVLQSGKLVVTIKNSWESLFISQYVNS